MGLRLLATLLYMGWLLAAFHAYMAWPDVAVTGFYAALSTISGCAGLLVTMDEVERGRSL